MNDAVLSFCDTRLRYTDHSDDIPDLGFTEYDPVTFMGHSVPREIKFFATSVGDKVPIYRYALDSFIKPTLITPEIEILRKKYAPRSNHVVVQRYRSGKDYISRHSDKVLDLRVPSDIVILSYGVTRKMVFTNKTRPTIKVKVQLRPGSVLTLGPKTNMDYNHEITIQKSIVKPRVSLTFREVASFYSEATGVVGQGAAFQETATSPAMIEAFGRQNFSTLSDFQWDAIYGKVIN